MIRSAAEWLWRAAMLCALLWVGYELRSLHADLLAPVEGATTAEADPGEIQDSLEAMREALGDLNRKVEILISEKR
jgi:hypothetical protein